MIVNIQFTIFRNVFTFPVGMRDITRKSKHVHLEYQQLTHHTRLLINQMSQDQTFNHLLSVSFLIHQI